MKNIAIFAVISCFTLTSLTSKATELVDAKSINTQEFIETVKVNLAQEMKLNTISLSPAIETAHAYIAQIKVQKGTEKSIRTIASAHAE